MNGKPLILKVNVEGFSIEEIRDIERRMAQAKLDVVHRRCGKVYLCWAGYELERVVSSEEKAKAWRNQNYKDLEERFINSGWRGDIKKDFSTKWNYEEIEVE